MPRLLNPDDPVDAITLAWLRERPDTPVEAIGIVTRIWQCAKLLGEDRRRVLSAAAVDAATMDLLSVLRRSGSPYRLTTRQLTERTMVTAGAISQRLAAAERDGLVTRAPDADTPRAVLVTLTPAGHQLVEQLVDQVLEREAQLIAGLDANQQASLTGLLRHLLDDLHDNVGPKDPTQVGSDRP